jgi:hypothetical protein
MKVRSCVCSLYLIATHCKIRDFFAVDRNKIIFLMNMQGLFVCFVFFVFDREECLPQIVTW